MFNKNSNQKKIGFNLGGLKISSNVSKDVQEKQENQQNESKVDKQSDGFGSFGKIRNELTDPAAAVKQNQQDEISVETNPDIAKVMGFSGFGNGKKAKNFDMAQIMEEAKRKAQERNLASNQQLEQQYEEMRESNPIIKKATSPTTSNKNETKDRSISNSTSSSGESSDDEFVGPPIPTSSKSKVTTFKQSDLSEPNLSENEEDEKEETLEEKIPRSHECKLEHGSKAVSALAIDPSGSRLVSGSIDYEVKFWNFAGMDSNLKNFRSIKPCESHVIRSLEYSSTGDKILVISGSWQAKVLDRDGHELLECVKGDPYVVDVRRSKGHVGFLTSGSWHPKVKDEFLTASNDGSLRLWMTEANGRTSKDCIKCKSASSGLKTTPTASSFSRDGLLVSAACQDGSIQMWDHRKSFVNTAFHVKDAHQKSTDTSSIVFGYDNRNIATRNIGDETLKLWDIRAFKKPINVAEGLYSRFDFTDCCFSPDDKMVVTATSKAKGEESGKLIFYEKDSFKKLFEMAIGDSHVIRALWHPKLNQIMVGCGDGAVRVYYDPDRSINGAKLCVVRKKAKAKGVSFIAKEHIITPYSLPLFREERQRSVRRQEEIARKNPVKSHRPDLPLGSKGTAGRVSTGGSTLHSWMAKQIAVKNMDDHIGKCFNFIKLLLHIGNTELLLFLLQHKLMESHILDPRERILRHAKESEENPYWIAPCYEKTQPKSVFRETSEDEPPEKMTKTETFG